MVYIGDFEELTWNKNDLKNGMNSWLTLENN